MRDFIIANQHKILSDDEMGEGGCGTHGSYVVHSTFSRKTEVSTTWSTRCCSQDRWEYCLRNEDTIKMDHRQVGCAAV